MDILCTIGARGGSKGLSNKNICELAGKPLIYYTIEQALKWGKAKRVVVSTDSKEIADIARKCGANVPFMRPKELATDNAAKLPVIRHSLLECEKIFHEEYQVIVDLDATAPIRTIQDLDNCLDIFLRESPDTLFSVVQAHKNPYFNMVEVYDNGKISLCKQLKSSIVRRQDAPKVYSLNASIYFYQRNFLLNKENITCLAERSRIYIMDDIAGTDIDREIDFKFVEFLVKEGLVNL